MGSKKTFSNWSGSGGQHNEFATITDRDVAISGALVTAEPKLGSR